MLNRKLLEQVKKDERIIINSCSLLSDEAVRRDRKFMSIIYKTEEPGNNALFVQTLQEALGEVRSPQHLGSLTRNFAWV